MKQVTAEQFVASVRRYARLARHGTTIELLDDGEPFAVFAPLPRQPKLTPSVRARLHQPRLERRYRRVE